MDVESRAGVLFRFRALMGDVFFLEYLITQDRKKLPSLKSIRGMERGLVLWIRERVLFRGIERAKRDEIKRGWGSIV
jgi:hypothetical protein